MTERIGEQDDLGKQRKMMAGEGRRRARMIGGAALGAIALAMPALVVSGSAQAATGTGSSAATANPTATTATTLPTPAQVAAVAKATANVPLPPIPKVSPTYTDGQNPAKLLARAIALVTAGDKAVPLQSALSGAEATLVNERVKAAEATAQATAANQRAAAAGLAARELRANATSLGAALREATLTLYMTGRPTALPDINAGNGDAVMAAMIGEQVALSPGGILAERKHAATGAVVAATQARKAQKAADADAVRAQTASAAATKQVGVMAAELTSLGESTATTLKTESTTLAQEASKDLASATALQFSSATPPPAPVATTTVALSWVFSELGKKYVYGATGPNTFDCSGLMQYVWNKAGVAIPRVAANQYAYSVPIPLSELRPGDLVFFVGSDGTRANPGHVGMYIGGGLMINAPYTGTVVQVSSIWYSDLIGFGRVHAPGVPVPSRAPIPPSAPPAVVASLGTIPAQDGPPPGVTPVTEPTTTVPRKVPVTTPSSTSTSTSTTSTTEATTTTTGSSTTVGGSGG